MMRLARRASLLVALCLLASAATAYADCAWVIWRNSVSLRPGSDLKDNWFPEEAVETHQACEAIVKAKNTSQERVRDLAASTGGARFMDYSYLCLPDTVDPRGPKAK